MGILEDGAAVGKDDGLPLGLLDGADDDGIPVGAADGDVGTLVG